jgi:hypothetical protein
MKRFVQHDAMLGKRIVFAKRKAIAINCPQRDPISEGAPRRKEILKKRGSALRLCAFAGQDFFNPRVA